MTTIKDIANRAGVSTTTVSNVIHGKTYYHVENMERSLYYIRKIVERIVSKSGGNGFAIIADHGATVGHKLKKKDKKYNFKNSDHDGRCCLLRDGETVGNSDDYAVYTNPNGQNWIISLTGQSLYNSSKYEVHGGGTPEEVIVPVIIANSASLSTFSSSSEYLFISQSLINEGMFTPANIL